MSKPEQIRKKLAQCDAGDRDNGNRILEEKNKKRARSEELLEALANIQQTQAQQTSLLTALLNRPAPPTTATTATTASAYASANANAAYATASANANGPTAARPVLTLEDSLDSLLDAFGPQVSDRPMKLARYVESMDVEKKALLTKMSHFFLSLNEPTTAASGDFSSDLSSDDANVMGMEQETYQWFSSF